MKTSTEIGIQEASALVMLIAGVAGVLVTRKRLATGTDSADRHRYLMRIRLWSALVALSVLGLVTAFLR